MSKMTRTIHIYRALGFKLLNSFYSFAIHYKSNDFVGINMEILEMYFFTFKKKNQEIEYRKFIEQELKILVFN